MKLHSCQADLDQKAFELPFIPARVSLSPFNNKGRVFSNPVTYGFIDFQRGLNINEFDEKTMFMELDQFPDPVGEFHNVLFQVRRVLIRLSLVELLIKTRFAEEDFTVSSVIVMSNHIGDDFQPYRAHSFPLFIHKKHSKGVIGLQE